MFVAITGLMLVAIDSQSLGMTRMNLPYMLGTMVTPNRDRARLLGFVMHFLNGWGFAMLYAAAFDSWRRSGWWRGVAIGAVHGLFVLIAGVPLLPGLHPRMAGDEHGPTPTRQLEPPGFMALNYGRRTPISVMLAHLLYGAILGHFYEPDTSRLGR